MDEDDDYGGDVPEEDLLLALTQAETPQTLINTVAVGFPATFNHPQKYSMSVNMSS